MSAQGRCLGLADSEAPIPYSHENRGLGHLDSTFGIHSVPFDLASCFMTFRQVCNPDWPVSMTIPPLSIITRSHAMYCPPRRQTQQPKVQPGPDLWLRSISSLYYPHPKSSAAGVRGSGPSFTAHSRLHRLSYCRKKWDLKSTLTFIGCMYRRGLFHGSREI